MEDFKQSTGQNLGIAALITAIITFMLAVIPCVGILAIIPGIIAIVLASVGLSQAVPETEALSLRQDHYPGRLLRRPGAAQSVQPIPLRLREDFRDHAGTERKRLRSRPGQSIYQHARGLSPGDPGVARYERDGNRDEDP